MVSRGFLAPLFPVLKHALKPTGNCIGNSTIGYAEDQLSFRGSMFQLLEYARASMAAENLASQLVERRRPTSAIPFP